MAELNLNQVAFDRVLESLNTEERAQLEEWSADASYVRPIVISHLTETNQDHVNP